MAKLHELLAVEGDLEAGAKAVVQEATVLFSQKTDAFLELHRSVNHFDEKRHAEDGVEFKALVTTVPKVLEQTSGPLARWIDAFVQKEATNQRAKADLVVDGEVLAKDVPATALLGLESRLKGLRAMFEAIPVLATGKEWEEDAGRGLGIYKDKHPEVRMRTEKTVQHKVLVQATEHHPAQIERWTSDVPVGRITLQTWSGMLKQSDKDRLLKNLDGLIVAVKRARQRANTADVDLVELGDKLVIHLYSY